METKKTPKNDLMNTALKHYEEASNAIHHFNSDIPKAIKAYFQQPEQPESAEQTDRNKFIKMGCIDVEKDLWANVNCQNLIEPATCGRELSCEKCDKYVSNISQSHNNTVVKISDIDIKANFPFYYDSEFSYDEMKDSFKAGAEYALSQCKAVDLKDKLRKAFKAGQDSEKALWQYQNGIIDGFTYKERSISFDDWYKDFLKSPENK